MSANAHAEAMNEMIESTNKAEAEANRLKRKYEPDEPEALVDKILELSDDNSLFYMRVEIYTGASMTFTLIPSTRNNGNVPDWGFKPSIAGTNDNVEDFGMFGIYRVYVGDGGDGHDLLASAAYRHPISEKPAIVLYVEPIFEQMWDDYVRRTPGSVAHRFHVGYSDGNGWRDGLW
jgi:hypothetical protein